MTSKTPHRNKMTAFNQFHRILSLLAGTFVLVCHMPAVSVSALSSSLKGYHFGTSSATTTTTTTAKFNSKKVTASDVLRQGRRQQFYVPDGLTLEQYTKIKNDEQAKTRSKNFGAWGPRFKLVDGDPDSNWFNLPSLWTGGYNANNVNNGKQKQQHQPDSSSGLNVLRKRMGGVVHVLAVYLRRYALTYVMLLLSTHLLLNKLSLLPAKNVMSMTIPKFYWPRTLALPLAVLKLPNFMVRILTEKKILEKKML